MTTRHELVERWIIDYADRVFRLAYALIGERTRAEDAAQESLYHIARWCLSHPEFTPTDAWVYQVTRNAVRDMGRRHTVPTVMLDEGQLSDSPEDRDVDRLDVARTLALLSPRDREVLVGFYFLDLSTAEVAQMLGISPTAVRIRLSRARSRFRHAFGRRPEGVIR